GRGMHTEAHAGCNRPPNHVPARGQMRSRQGCRGRARMQRPEDRFTVAAQVTEPLLTATACGGAPGDRVVPPEAVALTRRVSHDEHRRGNVERAKQWPRVLEDA